MTPIPEEFTVADLEKILNAKKVQVEELAKKRAQLQKQLAQVDAEIQALIGTTRRPLPGTGRRGPRTRNEKSLRDHVLEILSKAKKGHTLAELAEQVQAAGYHTASSNFRNVLYQCLYNTKDVYHDEASGTYKLKSLQTREFDARTT